MKLEKVIEIISKTPETREEEHRQAEIDGALFQHCHDRFVGLVKALGEATTIIEDEWPVGSEKRDTALKLRELLEDAREVKEI